MIEANQNESAIIIPGFSNLQYVIQDNMLNGGDATSSHN